MNILILTPIDPTSIIEVGRYLYSNYEEHNDIISIQMMSLLEEELNHKHNYIKNNLVFNNTIIKNSNLLINKFKYKNHIFYGNLNKNINIKFDYIISYKTLHSENEQNEFDLYLNKIIESSKNIEEFSKLQWYTKSDSQYEFPTYRHLSTFLKTLGIKENQNGVQQ